MGKSSPLGEVWDVLGTFTKNKHIDDSFDRAHRIYAPIILMIASSLFGIIHFFRDPIEVNLQGMDWIQSLRFCLPALSPFFSNQLFLCYSVRKLLWTRRQTWSMLKRIAGPTALMTSTLRSIFITTNGFPSCLHYRLIGYHFCCVLSLGGNQAM